MGRWGDGLYESDSALDWFAVHIAARLERELIFRFAIEKVKQDTRWLSSVIPVIEIILLLMQHGKGIDVCIDDVAAIQRWRDVFLWVWDGEWDESDVRLSSAYYAYSAPEYRRQHRQAFVTMFGCLEKVASHWEILSKGPETEQPDLTNLLAEYPLPYPSVYRKKNREGKLVVCGNEFTYELIEYLGQAIVFALWTEVSDFVNESVWVGVDLLAFICKAYEQSPGVKEHHVRVWREETVMIWKARFEDEKIEWVEDDLYYNVMRAFDRLEAVARQYPPEIW